MDAARSVIILERSMAAGYSGVENELFYNPKTEMLFGDAKTSIEFADRQREDALARTRRLYDVQQRPPGKPRRASIV